MQRKLFVLLLVVSVFVGVLRAQSTRVTGGSDQDLRDLIAKYIGGYSTGQDVEIIVAGAPNNLPFALPTPPNTRLLATIVRDNVEVVSAFAADGSSINSLGKVIEFVYDTQQDAMTLAAFVREFTSRIEGLKETQFSESKPVGFNANSSFYAAYCAADKSAGLSIDGYADLNMGSYNYMVRLLMPAEAYMCSEQDNQMPPYIDPMQQLMPALTTPEGVRVVPQMAGVFYTLQDTISSQAMLVSERPLAEIYQAYAAQLEAAGWTRNSEEIASTIAYSTWGVGNANNREWVGTLMIAGSAQGTGFNAVITIESKRSN